jgi:rSAM/selenodomain-associated transferase 1
MPQKNSTPPNKKRNILIIFSKAPIIGQVKTRLAPLLTDSQICTLHLAFIKNTLNQATQLSQTKICLGYYPRGYKHTFAGVLPSGIELFCQRGRDLGERMGDALRRFTKQAEAVIIIGGDLPLLPLHYIQDAFKRLKKHQVVIGPATDGGYYLIGSTLDVTDIFSHIPWGTNKVFELTCTRLKQQKYKYYVLPPCSDVDTPDDLFRLKQYLTRYPDQLPAIREVVGNVSFSDQISFKKTTEARSYQIDKTGIIEP